MEDTYLDAPAMLRRINGMQSQAETIYREIEKTRVVMERLKKYFTGESANRLQKRFDEVASSYKDLHEYLKDKADKMNELVTYTQKTDEEQ